MWFYLPQSQARVRGSKKPFCLDTIFKQYRRRRWRSYWKIKEALWTFLFLILAVRVGSAALFTLMDFHSVWDAVWLYRHPAKLVLPTAHSLRSLSSRRNMMLISIHRDGFAMVEGTPCRHEDLPLAFYRQAQMNPLSIAGLVIDRECRMEQVYPVLRALRKAGLYRVRFIARSPESGGPGR